jgi:hypothetical protein
LPLNSENDNPSITAPIASTANEPPAAYAAIHAMFATCPLNIVTRRPTLSENTPVGSSNSDDDIFAIARITTASAYEPVTWAKYTTITGP